MTLELLSRQHKGLLKPLVTKTILLNGGIYVEYQQPLLLQKLLFGRITGPIVELCLTERTFAKRFISVFSEDHRLSRNEINQHWHSISLRGGKHNYHRLIRYLGERRKYQKRWETTLEKCQIPIRFIWGLQDPVSRKNISLRIKEKNPKADLVDLDKVGHYPQLEVPEIVIDKILATLKHG